MPSLGRIWFVFNELSARAPAATSQQGRDRMNGLVDAIATVINGRSAAVISVGEPDLWGAELAEGYTVTNWCNSAEHDRKTLLYRIATKTEFPAEVGEALENRFFLSEFFLASDHESSRPPEARGLGAAFLLDGIGASLPSEERWRQTEVMLRHAWIDDNDTVRSERVTALNLSEGSRAEAVSNLLLQRRQQAIKDEPRSLAARKAHCFPHLSVVS